MGPCELGRNRLARLARLARSTTLVKEAKHL